MLLIDEGSRLIIHSVTKNGKFFRFNLKKENVKEVNKKGLVVAATARALLVDGVVYLAWSDQLINT